MTCRSIVEYPDPRLRDVAHAVVDIDNALDGLVDDLIETLSATDGIGLSAPQLGVGLRVLVLKPEPAEGRVEAFVNPRLLSRAGFAITLERCLSLPDIQANVLRSSQVRVAALDRHGGPFERVLTGLPAVCLQHELDHLEGRLFIDRLSWPRSWLVRAPLAELRARVATPTVAIGARADAGPPAGR